MNNEQKEAIKKLLAEFDIKPEQLADELKEPEIPADGVAVWSNNKIYISTGEMDGDRLKGYYSKYPSNLSGYIYIYMRTWQVATEIPRPGIQWVEHDGSNESPVADWVSHVVEYNNGEIAGGTNPRLRIWSRVKRWALI